MSYTQIFYHIVFRTKNSVPAITQAHSRDLYKYIWGVIKNKNGILYRINGMPEHIHLVSDLHPTLALADYVKDIKVASSLWMRQSGLFPFF
ncbi:MAG: transposase [Bacteroides sp.]|nr:transposase [Bacteroides sp.]